MLSAVLEIPRQRALVLIPHLISNLTSSRPPPFPPLLLSLLLSLSFARFLPAYPSAAFPIFHIIFVPNAQISMHDLDNPALPFDAPSQLHRKADTPMLALFAADAYDQLCRFHSRHLVLGYLTI